jgi:hypothetical protein
MPPRRQLHGRDGWCKRPVLERQPPSVCLMSFAGTCRTWPTVAFRTIAAMRCARGDANDPKRGTGTRASGSRRPKQNSLSGSGPFSPTSRSSSRISLQILGYPISGSDDELRPGHRRYNFGWYRVADAMKMREMCIDDNGLQHGFSVPSPLLRKDLIAQMRAEADDLLPTQFRDCLRHIDRPFFTPVYDFCSPSLVFGRVALVGDAASTPRPHLGFGVAKAGAETQALAAAHFDHDDIDRGLAAYNADMNCVMRRTCRISVKYTSTCCRRGTF